MLRSLLSLILLFVTVNVSYSQQLSPVMDVTPIKGEAPLIVNFNYTIPTAAEQYINSVVWVPDWKKQEAVQNWSDTLDTPGEYKVFLGTECKDEFAILCTSGQIEKSQQVTIVVTAPNQVTANLNSTGTACNAPYSVTFTSEFSNDATSTSYSINKSDSTLIKSGTDLDFDHNFTQAGDYIVTVWASNGSTTATDAITVNIYPEIKAEFAIQTVKDEIYIADEGGNNIARESATVNFQDLSEPQFDGTPTLLVWDYGNGTSETFTTIGKTVTAFYDTEGKKVVTLVASNECGSDTFTSEIEVLNTTSVKEIPDNAITLMTLMDGHRFIIDSECVGCKMNVSIVDGLGNTVSNIYSGVARREFSYNTSELSAGFYMYRIQLGDRFKTIKFVK